MFKAIRTHPPKPKFVQVRHEEAAAFAAVAYGKYMGRLGVGIATSGPGGIHLLNGAFMTPGATVFPLLALTGHTSMTLSAPRFSRTYILTSCTSMLPDTTSGSWDRLTSITLSTIG
jgi:thiamine pyrophosphate-dependent acetolactate synthase large subunit-like protein